MDKRKRVLFCLQSFQHGGIPKCLEQLLSKMDHNKYDITLFCVFQDGPYQDVFAQYNVIRQDRLLWYLCVNLTTLSGFQKLFAICVKAIGKLLERLFGYGLLDIRLNQIARQLSQDSYDDVIAFSEGFVTKFVSRIKCVKKSAWIHIDYKRLLSYTNGADEQDIYTKFDHIVSPSKFSTRSFQEVYPNLSDKIVAIPNVLNNELIKKLGDTDIKFEEEFNTNDFKIISVGRICYEKRFFEIPYIVSKLKANNIPFKWYIIGSGSDIETEYLKDNISKYDVAEYVILLGSKDNPYPYIKKSDLLVVTSLSETFSYVIAEAKVLGTPVVSTDFGTAPEVVDQNSGIISPLESIDKSIHQIMSDDKLRVTFNNKLSDFYYDNESIIRKIEKLL